MTKVTASIDHLFNKLIAEENHNVEMHYYFCQICTDSFKPFKYPCVPAVDLILKEKRLEISVESAVWQSSLD